MNWNIIALLFFCSFSYALQPKNVLTPEEMFEQADSVVVIQMISGEFHPGSGDSYKICGKVLSVLKGSVGNEICIEDVDDYQTECFNRSLSKKYLAFIQKDGRQNYSSLWANDSVFEVVKAPDGWKAAECESRRSVLVQVGEPHITDIPYELRVSAIAESAFNRQGQADSKLQLP